MVLPPPVASRTHHGRSSSGESWRPHGQAWWRYGHDTWQTLTAALGNPDDVRAHRAPGDERQAVRSAPASGGSQSPGDFRRGVGDGGGEGA